MTMVTTAKLQCTTEYERFEPYEFNRDTRKDKHLIESMKQHGFDPGNPINCRISESGKLTIIQGHNRFETAKALGLPVWYIVTNSTTPVDLLERGCKTWNTRDFVTAFSRESREDYAVVLEYCRKTGIGLTAAMSMFAGESASSGNTTGVARSGRFAIKNRDIPVAVAELVEWLRERCGADWASNKRSVSALCNMVLCVVFDVERFKAKAESHRMYLEKQPTIDGMLNMYERIYNRQTQENQKVPLAFLSKKAAAARAAVKR